MLKGLTITVEHVTETAHGPDLLYRVDRDSETIGRIESESGKHGRMCVAWKAEPNGDIFRIGIRSTVEQCLVLLAEQK